MPNDLVSTRPKLEIRLADYTPPAFLIDTVDLSFELDPEATRRRRASGGAAQSGRAEPARRWSWTARR